MEVGNTGKAGEANIMNMTKLSQKVWATSKIELKKKILIEMTDNFKLSVYPDISANTKIRPVSLSSRSLIYTLQSAREYEAILVDHHVWDTAYRYCGCRRPERQNAEAIVEYADRRNWKIIT